MPAVHHPRILSALLLASALLPANFANLTALGQTATPTHGEPAKPTAPGEATEAPKAADKDANKTEDKNATAKRPSAKKRVKEVKAVTGTIKTEGHDVTFELYVQKAPTLCANFVYLAKRGFWDGREWHGFTRVIRQIGLNAIGYPLPREFAPDLTFDDPKGGLLCYPKVSDKSSDSANAVRFFITIKNQERWNLDFQIFGRVTSGLDHIVNLTEGQKIESITIEGDADNLLKAFDVEVLQWEESLERMSRSRQLPPGSIQGTPDRRTGEVLPVRPLDEKPADGEKRPETPPAKPAETPVKPAAKP